MGGLGVGYYSLADRILFRELGERLRADRILFRDLGRYFARVSRILFRKRFSIRYITGSGRPARCKAFSD